MRDSMYSNKLYCTVLYCVHCEVSGIVFTVKAFCLVQGSWLEISVSSDSSLDREPLLGKTVLFLFLQ